MALRAHSMFFGVIQFTAHPVSCSLFSHSADVCCGQSILITLNSRTVCMNGVPQLISHSFVSYCADRILSDAKTSTELQTVAAV